MVDAIFPLLLEVDSTGVLEYELVKLWDVGALTLHAVAISEGEGWLLVPVDDVLWYWSEGGLDRKGGSRDQTLDWDCGDGEEILVVVRPGGVTNLLGDALADSHRHSLVLQPRFVVFMFLVKIFYNFIYLQISLGSSLHLVMGSLLQT